MGLFLHSFSSQAKIHIEKQRFVKGLFTLLPFYAHANVIKRKEGSLLKISPNFLTVLKVLEIVPTKNIKRQYVNMNRENRKHCFCTQLTVKLFWPKKFVPSKMSLGEVAAHIWLMCMWEIPKSTDLSCRNWLMETGGPTQMDPNENIYFAPFAPKWLMRFLGGRWQRLTN